MQVAALEHHADPASPPPSPLCGGQAGEILAIDHHGPAAWLEQAGEDVQQGALAAARRAHQAGPRGRAQDEVGAAKGHGLHLALAVDVIEAGGLERHVHLRP
jgi:hypothetical protein